MIKIRIKNNSDNNFKPMNVKPVQVDLYKEILRLKTIKNK